MSEWELPSDVEDVSIERSGRSLWDSGVYDVTIQMAYLDQTPAGAISLNVIMQDAKGRTLTDTQYIKSKRAKGNKTFYVGKDGKKRPLPGYAVANSCCIAAAGQPLSALIAQAEKKQIMLYSYEEGKKIPQEKPVLIPLLGKQVKAAILKIKENKKVKSDNDTYVTIQDVKTFNECQFFGNAAGYSTEEILTNASEAVSLEKWRKNFEGEVVDKTAKTKPSDPATKSAASVMGTADLFGTSDSGATSDDDVPF